MNNKELASFYIKEEEEELNELDSITISTVTLNDIKYVDTIQLSCLFNKFHNKIVKSVTEIVKELEYNGMPKAELGQYFIEKRITNDLGSKKVYYVSAKGFSLLSNTFLTFISNCINLAIIISSFLNFQITRLDLRHGVCKKRY